MTIDSNPVGGELVSLDPLALLDKDLALAEKAFARLNLGEQVATVLRAPPTKRQALCELAHDTAVLVQALPPQDLWLTICAAGRADSLVLFCSASPAQVQFLCDVSIWDRDTWNPVAMLGWLQMIAAGGLEKIVESFDHLDPELVALFCKRWVSVYIREGDEDPADAIAWPREEAPVTLDGRFYFQISDVDVDQWLRPMLMAYGKSDLRKQHRLFMALFAVSETEEEELAYQNRTRRLEEAGFPAFDEAIAVYQRLAADRWDRLPRRVVPDVALPLHERPQWALHPVAQADLLLRDTLAALDDPILRDACIVELARMANRVLIADGHAITPEYVRSALQKVMAWVNIGLEDRAAGSVAMATNILRDRWLTHVFQWGYTLVMQRADAARRWLAQHPTERANDDADPATDAAITLERIRAASWKWPKWYIGPQTPDGILHRDFERLAELTAVDTAVTAA